MLRLIKNDNGVLVVSEGPGGREFELVDGQQLELISSSDAPIPCEWRLRFAGDPTIVVRAQKKSGPEAIGMIEPEEGMLIRSIGPKPSMR